MEVRYFWLLDQKNNKYFNVYYKSGSSIADANMIPRTPPLPPQAFAGRFLRSIVAKLEFLNYLSYLFCADYLSLNCNF